MGRRALESDWLFMYPLSTRSFCHPLTSVFESKLSLLKLILVRLLEK
jgi:hypothetical protein